MCCLLLCRLYYRHKGKRAVCVYLSVRLGNHQVALTYHTVVNDDHNLQILHFLKYTARCLCKNHQSRLFSSTTTGTSRLLLKSGWVTKRREVTDSPPAFSCASAKRIRRGRRRSAPPHLWTQTCLLVHMFTTQHKHRFFPRIQQFCRNCCQINHSGIWSVNT